MSYNKGQSLIGVVVVLVAVGLITGGLYFYLSSQIPEVPEITEKQEGEEIIPLPEKELPGKETIVPEETIPEKEIVPVCQNECSQTALKRCSGNGYQTCGNYDTDNCLEWSSIIACPANTICQNGSCIQRVQQEQRCADGTLYEQCSTNKPQYCDNGALVDKCSTCGCPINKECQANQSCFSTQKVENYKMAFILVESSTNPATQDDIDIINTLKQKTSERFAWATKNLASMDTTYPLIVLTLENNPQEVGDITKEFYKENPDDFHFITIFTTYPNSGSFHVTLKNNTRGIGLDIYDITDFYGSKGRLLGVNLMNHTMLFSGDVSIVPLKVNGILHETFHQWGAYVAFIDENEQTNNSLLSPYDWAHWDKKLETGYALSAGYSWIDNGDGTFTARTTDWKERGYSNLDLYLMGLISEDEIGPIKLIVSDYDSKYIEPGTTISGALKTISVQQIINAEGEREDVLQ